MELEDGDRVDAYIPNTGRLEHLTEPGRPFILRRDGLPPRTTEYTAIRAWDGCWVALEAGRAPQLLSEWLRTGYPFPGYGRVGVIEPEITIGRHRLDLRLTTENGLRVWVEVKSGGRAVGGVGLLSRTPSKRGVAHLATLGRLAEDGQATAAVFVMQRPDVRALLVGGDADRAWISAVRKARESGVSILAFGCSVTETEVAVDRQLPISWAH
jgi:DNA-binding sugar fermentation-stimulating protein